MMNYREKDGKLEPMINIYQEEADGLPLGKYGQMLMQYMREYHNGRMWDLAMNGTLMHKLHEREDYLGELKLSLLEKLEKQNPRPVTENFLEIVQHMNNLNMQAEEMVLEELYQPI